MATFLRRKLTRMMEKDDTPVVLSITRDDGKITLSKRELQRYTMLFTMLDSDKDDAVGGQEGASFLRRSGLDTDSLREIWRLASGGASKPKLNRDDFYVACKLVAATQVYGKPDMQPLFRAESLPIADFHYDLVPDVSVGGHSEETQDIAVRVTNPTQFGSGLDKHTKYQVTTITSLPQFSRKETTVWRRFSDFEWLHKRMSTCFPAAILPLFPAKKLVGNNDESFTRERAAALEVYVDKLAHHPALNNSLDLIVFLDATDEGLEAAKRYIEEKGSEEAESMLVKGVDMVMNIATTGTVAPPMVIASDDAFVAACASHGAALARLNAAVKTATALDFAQKAMCLTASEAGKSLIALAEHERKNTTICAATAAAVSEASAAARRAEAVLLGGPAGGPAPAFAGTAGTAAPAADPAAAAAFASHTHVPGSDAGGIAGMFSTDFNDPYAAFGGAASVYTGGAGSAAALGALPSAGSLQDMCQAVGEELLASSSRWTAQLKELDALLYAAMRMERDKEAELGEAIKRRDAAIDKVQEAHGTSSRKKKAYSSLLNGKEKDQRKIDEAKRDMDKAEQAVQTRKSELTAMTELLKKEMKVVEDARRAHLALKLHEYAKLAAAQAKTRAEAWQALQPSVTLDAAAAEASKEAMAILARKAEAKARAASAAVKAKAGTGATSSGSEASTGAGLSPGSAGPGAAGLGGAPGYGGMTGATLMFGAEETGGGMYMPSNAADL